jgi:hypothetical protein
MEYEVVTVEVAILKVLVFLGSLNSINDSGRKLFLSFLTF